MKRRRGVNLSKVIDLVSCIVLASCLVLIFKISNLLPKTQITIPQDTNTEISTEIDTTTEEETETSTDNGYYQGTHEYCPCSGFVMDSIKSEGHFESILWVPIIEQNPELPTGCEVTSLTMVLNYLGYDIDKLTLADEFLPKGEIGKTHPNYAFIGNPRDEHSYGANAPVLVKTANDYLNSIKAMQDAYYLITCDIEDLMHFVKDGYPVVVWVTKNMEDGYPSTKWMVDGEEIQWYAKEHSMVLVGYTNTHYILADPLSGEYCYYEKTLVEKRYDELGNQALVIY